MDPGITEAPKNEPKKRGGPMNIIMTLLDVVHNYVHNNVQITASSCTEHGSDSPYIRDEEHCEDVRDVRE